MKTKSVIFATLLLIILLPSAALAVDFDYYVYGGFDAVVNAFNKLALVFGDNGYMSFYAFSITAGIFFGCVTVAARILGAGSGSPMSWIVPALVGIAVYLSLAVPKGTLHIYDPVYNKNQAIGGIPAGVVVVAGVLNSVERGLVDIVSTSGDPLSYQSQAGGKGFLGLYQITSLPLSAVNSNIDMSMRNYIKDCVAYEITRPGTTLTVDALRKTSTDFAPLLAQAQNPSIYTVYYDSTTPNGQSMTCTNAWTNISAQLTPANLGNNLNAVCSALGYDPAVAASLTQCKTVLNNVNTGTGLGAASVDDFVKQAYISQRLDEIFRSGNATGATNYQFLINASGSMKAANEWLPVLRAVLTAVAVGLIPFLALFIPTPIIGKAVGAIFGFFVWLTAWGVVDAIIHQFAIDYANSTFQLVRQNNLGMDAFYFFPDQTTKILGMFGTLRMSGMMLATVLTGMLVKFGGHAMAMMAGSLSGQIQSAGSRAAHEVEDPAGRASSIQRNSPAIPTQAWGNEHSFWTRGAAAKAEMDFKTGDGLSLGSEGFSQGFNARQVSMGTTDAFVKSGGPRASAALGTSMVRAPTGIMETAAGQNWMKHSTGDGKIATLTSGQQKLTFSNGMITDASGMHLGIKYGEGIKAGYSEARSQAESQAEKFDMMTGKNFMSSLTNNSGSTSMEAIGRKYSVSQGTGHELSKSLSNTASIIGSKATSIKDEHGNSVSKDAYGSFVAEATAATPFGGIAPIHVAGTAQGGYKITGTTRDGTTHSFSVDVADRKGVEKAVGESWRDTSSRLRSTDLSSNDQKAIGEMMQVSSTESTTTQAGAAWSRARSIEKRESEEVAHSLSSSQDYDTAFVKWYGDRNYGEMPAQERYANAASDLNNMATNADKGAINKVFGEFMGEKALAPASCEVRGDHAPVPGPDRSPSSLDKTAAEIGGAHDRINSVKNGIPEPTHVPSNIAGFSTTTIQLLIDALYSNPKNSIYVQSGPMHNMERIVLALWLQQWPRLKRNFRFCTWAPTDRSRSNEPFDFQVIPHGRGGRPHKGGDRSVTVVDINCFEPTKSSVCDQFVVDDLVSGFPESSLRKFLFRYGAEAESGRAAFRGLCSAWAALESNPFPDIVAAVAAADLIRPSIPSLSRRIVNEIVQYHFKDDIDPTVVTFLLRNISLLADDIEVGNSCAVAAAIWKYTPDRIWEFFTAQSPFERAIAKAAAKLMTPVDALSRTEGNVELFCAALEANPGLAASPMVWDAPEPIPSRAAYILSSRRIEDVNVLFAMMEANNHTIPNLGIGLFGQKAVDIALTAFESEIPGSKLQGRRWLTAARQFPSLLLNLIAENRVRELNTLMLISSLVSYRDPVIGVNGDGWVRSLQSVGRQSGDADFHFCSFLLARALSGSSSEPGWLMAYSFDLAHQRLLNSEEDKEGWGILDSILPEVSWYDSWDRAFRLRLGVVKVLVSRNLPPDQFLKLTSYDWTFNKLLDALLALPGGRDYLHKLRFLIQESTTEYSREWQRAVKKRLKRKKLFLN